MAYTDDDVSTWTTAASNLHELSVPDDLARDAEHAAAMLMSGSGFRDAPMEVLRMFSQLLEAGYAKALQDVRDGDYDLDLVEWRGPELADPDRTLRKP
jgi:hypothetical protein